MNAWWKSKCSNFAQKSILSIISPTIFEFKILNCILGLWPVSILNAQTNLFWRIFRPSEFALSKTVSFNYSSLWPKSRSILTIATFYFEGFKLNHFQSLDGTLCEAIITVPKYLWWSTHICSEAVMVQHS